MPPGDDPCNRCRGSGKVEVKITGATSLLELQRVVYQNDLDVNIKFIGSMACYRCIVTGPCNAVEPKSASGLGRDLGEALAAGLNNYDNHIFQERS